MYYKFDVYAATKLVIINLFMKLLRNMEWKYIADLILKNELMRLSEDRACV